jgi:hypothetical protein
LIFIALFVALDFMSSAFLPIISVIAVFHLRNRYGAGINSFRADELTDLSGCILINQTAV